MGTEGPQVLYRMLDATGQLLYVGITMRVPARFQGHRVNKPWWPEVASIRLEHFDSRAEVEQAESIAIRTERPLYNILKQSAPLGQPPYEPSAHLLAVLGRYNFAQGALAEAREKLRSMIANELKTNADVTNDQLAGHLPWTNETVRGIAREYGVPHKRKPTVRSIKPKRRTTA